MPQNPLLVEHSRTPPHLWMALVVTSRTDFGRDLPKGMARFTLVTETTSKIQRRTVSRGEAWPT